MDFARLSLARAVQDKSLAAFLDRNVQPAMMPDAESAAVLKWVLDFHKTHGDVPSPQTVEAAFPAYRLTYAAEPASYYVERVLTSYARTEAVNVLLDHAKKLGGDRVFDVVGAVQSKMARLHLLSEARTERAIADNTADRWRRYLARKNGVGLIGIPTPWDSLDTLTQGWQPEDYVVVVARPKTGKTWLVLRLAYAAWLAGHDVLFVNKELPDDMMDRRWDALHHKLPYQRFREGLLTDAEEARYKAGLETVAKGAFPRWTWLHGASTVSAIGAKVEQLKPGLVVVDGAYLLMDEDGGRMWWEKNRNISQGLKRLPQRYRVPLIATVQLAKTGDTKKHKDTELTASDIGGSDAYAQDTDLALALVQTEDQRRQRVLDIVPLAAREAPPETIQVEWNFETMNSADLGQKTRVILLPDGGEVPAEAPSLDFDE